MKYVVIFGEEHTAIGYRNDDELADLIEAMYKTRKFKLINFKNDLYCIEINGEVFNKPLIYSL